MLMNPTETSALVVKAHCLTLTVWVPKGSLVSPPPSFLFHSVHLQLSRLLAAQTDREQCRIINRPLQYSLHLRCKEQGFYVPTDGFSIKGGATQLIKNEWRQALCIDNYDAHAHLGMVDLV